MKFTIAISDVKRIKSPVLRGTFTLKYGGIKILGMLVFAKDSKRWVSFPSQIDKADDGSKSYTAILKATTRDSFDKLNKFCMDNDEIDALFKNPPKPVQEEAWPALEGNLPEDLPF